VLDESTISEATISSPSARQRSAATPEDIAARHRRFATYGYAFLVAAIFSGWILRDWRIVDPSQGTGYWLGIVGASLMLFLLLYPLRKKMAWLGVLGSVRNWFRMHIFFGLFGPLLILYHCNFSLGSVNSQVALYSMLVVAGSGIVGLHIYRRIHRGLNGKKTNLLDLQNDLTKTMDANHGLAALMPNLVASLEVLSAELQGDEISRTITMKRSLGWLLKQEVFKFKLKRIAKKELSERAAESSVIARDFKRLRRAAISHTNGYVKKMSRVAQFSLYERLFSIWHVFHLPLFIMLVLSASVHVLAVHMY
jgi:hypothetical protein